jgi:hypothetical protein
MKGPYRSAASRRPEDAKRYPAWHDHGDHRAALFSTGDSIRSFNRPSLARVFRYACRGNVRELRNGLEARRNLLAFIRAE